MTPNSPRRTPVFPLGRRHPTLAPAPGRSALVQFDYRRGGTLAYLAAFDVHSARLFDRCEEPTGIEPFGRLVEQVMTDEPHASARAVLWIVEDAPRTPGAHRSSGARASGRTCA